MLHLLIIFQSLFSRIATGSLRKVSYKIEARYVAAISLLCLEVHIHSTATSILLLWLSVPVSYR